jgi:hypothetical protein
MHPLQPPELAHRLFQRLLREMCVLDARAILGRLLGAGIDLAQLALDGAELLAEEVLALSPAHLLLRLGLDLRLHRGDLELPAQQGVHLAQPRQGVADLQDLLGLTDAQLQVRGHQVRQAARLPDVRRDREDLRRQVLEREQLLDPGADRAHQRLGLDGPLELRVRRHRAHLRPGGRLVLDECLDARLGEPLDQRLHPPVRQAKDAHHHRHGPEAEEVVRIRVVDRRVPLRGQQQQAVPRQGVLDGGDGALAGDEERQHHVGEDDELPKGQDRDLFGDRELEGAFCGHPPAFRRG